MNRSWLKALAPLILTTSLLTTSAAMGATTDPTMSQIYATAQAGKLADAQVMVQQVLVSHPTSAKAFFVQAELYARQGQLALARESLAKADQFAPGLPFAKPDAVQALRAQVAAGNNPAAHRVAPSAAPVMAPPAPAAPSSGTWVWPTLITAGVMLGAFLLFRRRTAQQGAYGQALQTGQGAPAGYSGGLSGPQGGFGSPSNGIPPGNAPAYGPAYNNPAYGQQPYPQPAAAAPGLGGRIMGGVATGLAVGAGVMAAEAIGRTLTGSGHNGPSSPAAPLSDGYGTNSAPAYDAASQRNTDMGGANFGINDTASWDDGGAAAQDGGGSDDWDN
jgi:hypothetical protein